MKESTKTQYHNKWKEKTNEKHKWKKEEQMHLTTTRNQKRQKSLNNGDVNPAPIPSYNFEQPTSFRTHEITKQTGRTKQNLHWKFFILTAQRLPLPQ